MSSVSVHSDCMHATLIIFLEIHLTCRSIKKMILHWNSVFVSAIERLLLLLQSCSPFFMVVFTLDFYFNYLFIFKSARVNNGVFYCTWHVSYLFLLSPSIATSTRYKAANLRFNKQRALLAWYLHSFFSPDF